ncbi:MAG: hypothetical protein ACERKD_08475 [Prolixibacteraceae bacterium]
MSIALYKMERVIYTLLIFFGIYSCSPKGIQDVNSGNDTSLNEKLEFSVNQWQIVGDVQPFNTEIKIDTLQEDVYLINVNLYTDFPSYLPKFEFHIKYPQKLIHSLWSSRTWTSSSYINIPNYSRLQSDYNIVSGLTSNSMNRITIAAYDNFKSRYSQIDIKQIPDSLIFSINFFNDAAPDAEVLEYKAQILVDLSDEQFSKSIRNTSQWRLDKDNNTSITKVDLSLQPIYSLWYPMDRNIPLENVTHYFDSIAAMGFKSVLFDDGWQNVVRFEVDKNGDWEPSNITIVKEFMEKVKEANMKVALWYSFPVVGANNYVFQRFDGHYLQYRTSSQPILDIRYPEVREYLTSMYKSIVTEWGVDGIWFNFLNGYYPDEHIIVTEDRGRDFVSVRKSLDSLRSLMEYELIGENPEMSINQSYTPVGPLHTSNTKTINGFLGTSALGQVREKLVNNRLLYGEYSPFMEIMGIHPKDPAVDVAKKFQTILFGIPYVSYFSYTLPDDIRETIAYWIKYWKLNSTYLVESEFEAYNPVLRYPVLWGGDQTKQIVIFYERVEPFDLKYFSFEEADIINSSGYDYVSLKGTPTGKIDYIIYSYKGVYLNRGTLKFKQNIATIEIPQGGFARLLVK